MKNNRRLIIGSLIFAILLVHWVGNTWLVFRSPGSYDGWSGSRTPSGGGIITAVDPHGPATALQIGDEILAVNNVPVNKGNPHVLNFNRYVVPGTHYPMLIRRAGQQLEILLYTVPYPKKSLDFGRLWMSLVYLLFLLTGGFVFLLRRDDQQAWLLALMLGTLTAVVGTNLAVGLPDWLSALLNLAQIIGIWFLPFFLHFFLIFPEPSPLLRKFPKLDRWLYIPFLLIVFPTMGLWRLPASLIGTTFPKLIAHPCLAVASRFLLITYIVLGLLSLVLNYRAADQMARRRLRVVLAGSGVGFLNLLLMPLGAYLGLTAKFPTLWDALDVTLSFTLPLVPLSFAYAIIRHKVIPVSLLIRRGVRYLLVSHGAILLVGLVVALLVAFDLWLLIRYLHPSSLTLALISAGVAIVGWTITGWAHRRFLAPVIDRKFFRQAYNSQQLITELAESLRGVTHQTRLLEMVASKIQTALQTENVTIFLREQGTGNYLSTYSCAYNATTGKANNCHRQACLPNDSIILARLSDNGDSLEYELMEQEAGFAESGRQAFGAYKLETETLREVKAALLLPLKAKDDLLGVISLGPRLGDLPYSSDDKRLLMSVVAPAALALENTRLIERMVEEARRREELQAENEARQRELEEARQLQLSMLPKNLPSLPHLEIAAYMKTATEVGGDYYDFHLDSHGTLTIAIGDATGHGLKAGTVVTAMKSLFRTLAHEPEMPKVFTQSSRVLKEMNLRSLFMALTMAKLTGYRLRLVGAGMPPAFIYRALTGTLEEVVTKGLPLGSLSNYTYLEHELTLDPGDVILLMSDGFPERFNPDGEELGYEPARQILATATQHPATKIVERLVEVGDTWAQDRPQDDDITFVILKVKA
jgi:phosphoserine phosphatase RsbU/P